jgi:DNA-binding NtrC family response regulator
VKFKEYTRECQRRYIEDLLRRARGCVSRAARMGGINRTHFYKLMRRHGIPIKRRQARGGNDAWRSLDSRPQQELRT